MQKMKTQKLQFALSLYDSHTKKINKKLVKE